MQTTACERRVDVRVHPPVVQGQDVNEPTVVPQTQPLDDEQVQNAAGGYAGSWTT